MSSKLEVNVTGSGVQFGSAWFSHESITGYTAEQLNSGDCHVTGREYMKWLSSAAAPVVERQPVAPFYVTPNGKMYAKAKELIASPTVQRQLKAFASLAPTATYATAPPELAELQAPTNAALIKDLTDIIAQQAAEIERLKDGQGEPVYQTCNGVEGWIDVDLLRYTACSLEPEGYETRILYTSQPAPVSVDERAEFVAWVRHEWPQAPLSNVRDLLPKNDPRYGEYCDETLQRAWVGWQARACLDKLKELNQ